MPRKVLITGATGDTGRAAVREAIALGLDYPVAPGLITAAVNFAQAARKAGTKAVLNLSEPRLDQQLQPRHLHR